MIFFLAKRYILSVALMFSFSSFLSFYLTSQAIQCTSFAFMQPSRCYFFLIEKCRAAGEAEFFIFLAKFHRDSMLLFDTSHKMEPWIYGSEGKAFVISDEMFPPTNGFVHAKEVLTGWDLRNTFNYRNPSLIPSSELTKDVGLVELRFHGSPKGTSTEKPMGGSICKNVSDGRTVTSYLFSQKAPFQKQESGSKDSSSITDINEHDSSFIGLKLGRLVDFKDIKNNKCPKDTRSTSVTSTVPAKKMRSTCLNGQTPFCQVFGCNMDLSSSKDYHKRHKVCEIHSKTAKVIVNGIEQRFCQQCSRFHLLAEFDDGKRSCRKRLAGHNERRRKPQLDIHSRTGKLLQTYHDAGGNFLDTSLPVMASFLCPDIFPSGILHEIKYGNGEIPSSGQPPMSAATGQLFPKYFLPHHKTEKQFSSMYNVGNPSGNISYEYGTQIEQSSAGSNFVSDSGSNIQDFSGVTVACCAPSLLSSQSRTASSYSSASPMAQPLAFHCGQAHCSTTQLPEKPLEVISHTSTSSASNRFFLSEMNSPKDEQMGLLVSSASNTLGFKVQTDVVYEGPQLVSRELLSPEHVDTVNLLQLSILLQSAEEKGLVQAKEECGVFSCLPITEVE